MDYSSIMLHQSGLKHLKSIEQFLQYHNAERVQTPAMAFGTALHLRVLQPDEFKKQVVVSPDVSRATKEYKEFAAANEGKMIIKPDEAIDIEAMTAALYAHPRSKQILEKKENIYEQSITWEYPCGLNEYQRCNSTPDIFHARRRYIADIKTCESADLDSVIRTISTYEYHLQSEFYKMAVVEAGFMKAGDPISFYFIFVEKSAPYGVLVVELDESWAKLARRTIEARIRKWRQFVKHPYIFKGYSDEIVTLSAPKYLEYKEEDSGATKEAETYKPIETPKTDAVESPQLNETTLPAPEVLPEVKAEPTEEPKGQASLFQSPKELLSEKYNAMSAFGKKTFTENLKKQYQKSLTRLNSAEVDAVILDFDNLRRTI